MCGRLFSLVIMFHNILLPGKLHIDAKSKCNQFSSIHKIHQLNWKWPHSSLSNFQLNQAPLDTCSNTHAHRTSGFILELKFQDNLFQPDGTAGISAAEISFCSDQFFSCQVVSNQHNFDRKRTERHELRHFPKRVWTEIAANKTRVLYQHRGRAAILLGRSGAVHGDDDNVTQIGRSACSKRAV